MPSGITSYDAVLKRRETKLEIMKIHIGEIFERLKIIDIEYVNNNNTSRGRNICVCQCSCGNITHVPYSALSSGRTRSCGCLHNELQSQNAIKFLHNINNHNWYYMIGKEKFNCRSGYEVIFANYLIKNNINFTYEQFAFTTSKNHTYTPDFYIIEKDIYIEIKGCFYEKDCQMEKIAEFRQQYNLKILYWDDIKNLCNLRLNTYCGILKYARTHGIVLEDYLGKNLYN